MLRLNLSLRGSASAVSSYAVPMRMAVAHRGMGLLFIPNADATIEKLADDYVSLPATKLVELHKKISEKMKVDYESQILAVTGGGGGGAVYAAPAPVSEAVPQGESIDVPKAAEPTKKKVEKATADVKLVKYPAEVKIKLIKELRTVTNLPLKDAKDAIDKAPGLVQTNMSKEDAEKLKKLFEGLGAEVELL